MHRERENPTSDIPSGAYFSANGAGAPTLQQGKERETGMSSAVQSSGVGLPSTDLGMSPLRIATLRFFGFGLGAVILGGIAAMNGGGVAGILQGQRIRFSA